MKDFFIDTWLVASRPFGVSNAFSRNNSRPRYVSLLNEYQQIHAKSERIPVSGFSHQPAGFFS